MKLKLILFVFLFKYVSSLKYHYVKSNGNILSVNSVHKTIEDVPKDTIALMFYENNVNKTGWANLELQTFEGYDDQIQAYYGGALEGYITGDLIDMNYKNNIEGFCDEEEQQFCHLLKQYLEKNRKFVESKIKENKDSDYWHQLNLVYKQLDGMQMGYDLWKMQNNESRNTTESRFGEIFLLNIGTEIWTLKKIIMPELALPESSHCSAIIKPLPDGSDLFISHNTWSPYQTMLRVMKKYSFAFNSIKSNRKQRIAGHSVSFSSNPGSIFSGDDYYVLSSGLVVQETTNENFNMSLYENIEPDQIILEFARNIIANRLADSGKEWTDLFGEYNSGTYNNQFMILDYKRFKRGTKVSDLSNDLLWIIEQMPTMIRAEDVTHVLRAQGYWASYNVPYFKDQFEKSGNADMAKKYGPFYTHENTARARIFRRDHSSVTDMKTLYALMRYNDFKNDPLSRCQAYNQTCSPPYSSDLTIAARNDLNDPKGKYAIDEWSQQGEGATDAKMTNSTLVWKLEMLAVSGPTDKQQTPFQWSKSDLKLKHLGHPDLFNFKPIYVKWYPNSYETATDV